MASVQLHEGRSLRDQEGEFGFLKVTRTGVTFKLTEEKYLTIEEMETILSYMRTVQKFEGRE